MTTHRLPAASWVQIWLHGKLLLLKHAEDGTMLEIAQKYVDQGLVIDSLCLINK